MPGLRILNIHPRMAGPLSRWRQLFELAAATGFNAVWLNPFHRTTEVAFHEHGQRRWRSLYAIADHAALDLAVTSGDPARDRAELVAAIAHARQLGLLVMVDLVVNHVAIDHPLVLAENERVRALMARPGARLVRSSGGAPMGIAVRLEGERGEGAGASYGSFGEMLELVFARNERLLVVDYEGTTGRDNAQIAFASAAARRVFLGESAEGIPEYIDEWSEPQSEWQSDSDDDRRGQMPRTRGYWKQLIDYYLELGVGGFRCDMAHNVPASWWRSLIAHARRRDPKVIFLAETLGGQDKNLELIDVRLPQAGGPDRPAFELVMLSLPWWDMKSEWLFQEIALTHHIAHHGGAAFPDSHDHEQTLAERYRQELMAAAAGGGGNDLGLDAGDEALQQAVAALCVRDYGVAALVGSSVIATLGYLFSLDQSSVFWDPERFARLERELVERADLAHPLNLRARIAEINAFLAHLPLAQAKVELDGMPRFLPADAPDRWPAAVAARDWVSFEAFLRHVTTGRPLGSVAVAVDRGYETRGPRLDRLFATIAAGPTPGLREALCETSEELAEAQAQAASPGGGAVASRQAPDPVWLETPLLVACYRAQPAAIARGAPSGARSSGLTPSGMESLSARAVQATRPLRGAVCRARSPSAAAGVRAATKRSS